MSGVKRAIRYAVEALILLRRHPSLLLVALAMAVVGAVDSRVGTYLAYTHTGWGQDQQELTAWRNAAREKSGRSFTFSAKPFGYMVFVTPPTPSLGFHGATQLLWAAAYGSAGKVTPPDPDHPYGRPQGLAGLHMLLSLFVTGLLPMILSCFISAGYLATARSTITDDMPRWPAFFTEGRRFYVRLVLFMIIWFAAVMPAMVIATLRGVVSIGVYATFPVFFLVTLTQFSIVADDIGVFAGIRRSVTTVASNLPVALPLILGTGVLNWAASLLGPWRLGYQTGQSFMADPFALLPRDVLSQCLVLAIGAWFTLAAFLWYGESHPRALRAHDLPETGESDESDPSRDIRPAP